MLPLVLEEVRFVAGGRVIIDSLSMEIDAGPRTVILGPNGAGKSVLMRLCHGLLTPTAGRITWRGTRNGRRPRQQAMVFQRPVMLRRSALANVTYGLELAGVSRRERELRAQDVIEAVGLSHVAGKPARVLSGGEQQKLALARAWALGPEVLFLDEPTANLDPGATRDLETIVGQIHASGTKIVMTTHNLGQARRLGDEILFIDGGRLVERAPVDRFFADPATAEAAAFIRGELPWT
ncbi:MAG: transporter ATP-binding protein [Betaproteobacteria bacterium]|nr:transporter ATP-binding protein [Betaproteobacteria bacterium]